MLYAVIPDENYIKENETYHMIKIPITGLVGQFFNLWWLIHNVSVR